MPRLMSSRVNEIIQKRCSHLNAESAIRDASRNATDPAQGTNDAGDGLRGRASITSILSPSPTATPSAKNEAEDVFPPRGAQDAADRHWIGDMNPESILLAATSPESLKRGDELGFWVSSPRNGTHLRSKLSLRQPRSNRLCFSDPLIQQVLLPYLEDQCLSCLPPQEDLAVLCKIYQTTIHGLFPVVVEVDAFDTSAIKDPAAVLIKQSICLSACKERQAAQHLRLPPDTSIVRQQGEFTRQVSSAMRTIIDLGLVTDKRVLTQVYCLMSLFGENVDNGDTPSQYASRAINCLYSLAIQIIGCAGPSCGAVVGDENTPAGQQTVEEPGKGRPKASSNSRLFCCCWALDRINAALHGRAVIMHERDWTRDLQRSIEAQSPSFQLFLRLAQVFDTVIDLFRPGNRSAMRSWEHSFPDFEQLVVASDASRVEMSSLATLEVLYHSAAILSHRTRSMDYGARSSASYNRRTHSASRITTIVGEEFKDRLSMFPTTPYAVSLCLSVGYSELRHSKIPLHQARARNQLLANCKILKTYGDAFPSALRTAEMAEQLVHEVDRAVSAAAGNPIPANASDTVQEQGEQAASQIANGATPIADAAFPFDIQDFDVFDHFDPAFDLATIDNAFVGNLDPSLPTSFNFV